jgi:hypothetical protein
MEASTMSRHVDRKGPPRPNEESMERSLLKRVERLEKDRRWQVGPAPSPADQLFRKKVNELLAAVDERYARLVTDDLDRNARQPESWSEFTLEFLVRVSDHVQKGLPLAFPPAVAEAYLRNPYAGNEAACEGCHYELPLLYFQLCPVCGEPVKN